MVADIHIHTQDHENYSDTNIPYWKPKGGHTVVLTGFIVPNHISITAAAQAVVDAHRATIKVNNDYYTSEIIDWDIVPAGQPTEDERMQQEYDGRVMYPCQRINLSVAA